jgi:hypothetical protein
MEDFTLEEFVMGDNSVVLVMIQESIDESPSYSVRYLVNRKFGFKTFESHFHADNFFKEIKSAISVVSS